MQLSRRSRSPSCLPNVAAGACSRADRTLATARTCPKAGALFVYNDTYTAELAQLVL